MLHFSRPCLDAPNAWHDHADAGRVYYLPDQLALSPVTGSDSAGSDRFTFFLLRYAGDFGAATGGLLQMGLTLERGDAALLPPDWQPVSFERAQLRLRLRSLLVGDDSEAEGGQWHPVVLRGGHAVTVMLFLDQTEEQLLQHLVEESTSDATGAVEADLRLSYRGLVAGLPFTVIARREALDETLAALLGDSSASAAQIEAAFLSLVGTGILSFQPETFRPEEQPEPPAEDDLLREAARRALPLFFHSVVEEGETRYVPQPLPPALDDQLRWGLSAARVEERDHDLNWSISKWHATLTDESLRAHYFPIVSRIAPFARATVHVINSLPLDPGHLREVRVDVRYPGPGGVPVNQSAVFQGGDPIQRFSTFYPAMTTAFRVEYRLTCLLAPAAPGEFPRLWPPVRAFADAPSPVVLEINRALAGMEFVELTAVGSVFDLCAGLDISIWPGETATEEAAALLVTLSAETPSAWAALPGLPADGPLYARCVARPPAGLAAEAVELFDGPLVGRRLAIYRYQLEALEPELITARLADGATERYGFIAVAFRAVDAAADDGGRLFTLGPDRPAVYAVWRPSIFEEASYQWRSLSARLDENGATLPLEESEWFISSAPELILGGVEA